MVMALGSGEAKSSKQCKVLKEKIIRKEKLILLLKELLRVKDKTTHENISQQLLTLRSRGQEANATLKKELFLSCNSTKKIVQLQEINRKTIEELNTSLCDRRGMITHLEFQNKQLVVVQKEHEKTIDSLKVSIKTLEKKAGNCDCVGKPKRKKLKDKSLEEPPPTPSSISSCPETSKVFPQPNLLTEGILTPASSISSSIPVASSPGIGWLDLDSRSNSPTGSLSDDFNVSHDSVPSLLTPIQSAVKKPPCDDESLPLMSEYDHCSEKPGVTVLSGSTDELKVTDQSQLKSDVGTRNSVVQDPDTLFNSSTDLVNSDPLKIMDQHGPKSKSTPATSIFDLPVDVSESEDEFSSNSREVNSMTKISYEQSFEHDLEMSDSSDLDTELNDHSPDVESSSPDNRVCHPTDEFPSKGELDKPEAADSGNLTNSCLPDFFDCVSESNVSQDTNSFKNQGNLEMESGNQDTFTDLSHVVPEVGLVKKPTTVGELNTTAGELIEVVENPTSKCMQDNVGDVGETTVGKLNTTTGELIEVVENPTSKCTQDNVVSKACIIDISTKGDVGETTVGKLNTTTGEPIEVVENPTSQCMQDNVVSNACIIDISTKGDVEITDPSTDRQTSIIESEIPLMHSPIPDSLNDGFSSDDSSPVKSEVQETTVSPNVMPPSSPKAGTSRSKSKIQRKLNPSTRSKIDCNVDCGKDISSRPWEVEDVKDSENSVRQTRSKSITPKRTTQRKTRRNAKEVSDTINESPKISPRRTRQNSTPKADLGARDRRRSSRINSSESFSIVLRSKRRLQSPKDRVEPVTHSLDSRAKLVSDSSSDLPPTGCKKPLKGKFNRKTCPQKQGINNTLPKSTVADESCHHTDHSVEPMSPVRSFKSDSCGDIAPSSVEKIELPIETDRASSELEVPDSVSSDMNKSSKSIESDSTYTHSFSDRTSANINGMVNTIDAPEKFINQEQSNFTVPSSKTGRSVISCDPITACMRDSNLEEESHAPSSNVISTDFTRLEEVNPIPQRDVSQLSVVSNTEKIMHPKNPIIDSSLRKISETANSKNLGNSEPSNGPETISPSIPTLRDGNNILCSANAAIQSFSSPFSKSFYSGSTMFGRQNLPSFSDLKPEDRHTSSETNQYWHRGANFNPTGSSYSIHRQQKIVDKRWNCGTPQSDFENLLVGQLCLSLNLLSLNPPPNNMNDNFFNFFTKFKKENISAVGEYSSTFLPSRLQSVSITESQNSAGCSDHSKFTNYRDAGNLNEAFDTDSEVTIQIKQEDMPFSLKLSVPAGKPLEPVLDSLRGMVREVQSKSASFAAHRHHPISSDSDSGSSIPTTNKFPGSSHYPPTGETSQMSACRTFIDSSIRPQSNDRFVSTNHKFKIENKIMPSCKWANDVIKQPIFPSGVTSHLTCNSTFSASKSIRSQSESVKLHESNAKLKTSTLGSEVPSVDDPNKGVNCLISGIPPIPLLNIGSPVPSLEPSCPKPLYPTVACAQSAGPSEQSGLGSSNDHSNPSVSNLESVAVEASDSAKRNQNPKTVDCAADAPVPPKQVSSKDSKAYSWPFTQFVSSGTVDSLRRPLSPNLKTTSSSCESLVSSFEVVAKKRRIMHSPREEVRKSEKLSTVSLTEEQKSEVLRRQSLCKQSGVVSPKKSQLDMNPPAPSRMLRSSNISPNLRGNLTHGKPKIKKQGIAHRISPRKCFAAQSIPAVAINHTHKPAIAMDVIGDALKDIAEDQITCSQCHLKTSFCSCEIERIMAEVTHFPFDAPLSPIPDSPEPVDLDGSDGEISYSGDLKNNTIPPSMEELIEPPDVPMDDSKTVEMCGAQEDAIICTKKIESKNEINVERRVTDDEVIDSGLLNNTISLSVKEISEPSGGTVDDHKTVETCITQEDNIFRTEQKERKKNEVKIERIVADDEVSDSGDLENNTISLSMKEINEPPSGPVKGSKTIEMSSTQEDTSILRGCRHPQRRGRKNEVNVQRRSRKKKDGIIADNVSQISDCEVKIETPAERNIKDCVNLCNNLELDKSNVVTFESPAIIPEDMCQLNSKTGVKLESDNDVLSNRPEENTVKRRLRSSACRPALASELNNKPAAPKKIIRRSRAGRLSKECSIDESPDTRSSVSEISMDCGQDAGLIPSDSSKEHLTIQNGCPESQICSVKPKEEVVELNNILEVENRDESSGEESVEEVSAKSADTITQDADLNMVTKNNQIADQTMSSSDIEKSVDKLLESIGTFPGSQLAQSRVERPELQYKPQHVGSRTTLDPLSHLGKFFGKNSSIVESKGSCVDGSGTSIVPERLASGTDDDSESDMMIDYSSCSESERKQNPQKRKEKIFESPSKEDREHNISLAAEKSKTASYQPDSKSVSQNHLPSFYMAAQGNNCDVNNEPSDETIRSSRSPPVSENTSQIQLPKFYTAIKENESVVSSQKEPEPKKLVEISSYNKIFCKLISEDDVIPCSVNMLEFASFYDLEDPEEKPFKFPESYERHKERIENSLNEFFLHGDLKDGLKKAISTLNKMKPIHVGKGLCAVVGESNPWIQPYERKGIACNFSKTQKKAAVLVSALAEGRLQYFDEVLNEIEEFLIPSPKSPNPTRLQHNAIINMSALYGLICRTQGFGLRVQSFIYDVLYGRHISSFRIIYQILLAIPQVIPWARDVMGPLTFTIVYLIMKQGIYQNLTPQYLVQCGVTQLRMRLTTKYGYSFSPDITRDTVMEELMSNVMVKGCDKAITLLSKSQGYKWTFSVVQKHIFPVIDKWINEEEDDEDFVVHIIRLLGLVSRCFAVSVCESFVSMSLGKVKHIIQKNPSLPISEAVAEALVHFKRLSPEGVIAILANWTPNDCKVTKSCVRSLKKISGNRPYSYWKQFMMS